MPQVTFDNQKKLFFKYINAQVDQYFKDHNLKKTGNKKLYIKSFLLIISAVFTYVLLLTVQLYPLPALLFCCLFGFLQATIGFNIMHDANHGSYADKKWINNMMSLSANMMGVNAWLWKQKHNIIHHTYTNVDGVDDDIAKSPFLRMCHSQKQFKIHRYQHIYCIPLYALSSLLLILNDFTKYFQKKKLNTPLRKMEIREHIIFWISKFFYVFIYLILPIWIVGFIPAIIGFALMHIILGFTLSSVFQLAHLVECTHFVEAKHNNQRIENEWAIHQVQTTADFATHNKVISWLTGGLNFQVEHHLFPKISHVHYPVIHNYVKDACLKFSVQFNNYPSMTSALVSHFRYMKQLGR